ncbi:MAG: hypothetical protein CM15mP2_2180 [Methanobacteriota archaeon]|nr:MAG: hypothetical protein CM15mP2_2180 [Euryarchaeota archaeon]
MIFHLDNQRAVDVLFFDQKTNFLHMMQGGPNPSNFKQIISTENALGVMISLGKIPASINPQNLLHGIVKPDR